MDSLTDLYRSSLWLLTDLYQLTMACAYRRAGREEDEAVFHLSFRRNPFGGGFTLACGLATVLDLLEAFRPSADDLGYLRALRDAGGRRLFDDDFLDWMAAAELALDVDAVPEGTVVFPHEPLLSVRGPVWQCQLLESIVSNLVNFQTLVATKAARISIAARGDPVVEFGMRRAQGPDGAILATRAAYVGGCDATSNVLAGKRFGIPVRGTHAHSFVMLFEEEADAFEAFADAYPDSTVLLVDTWDSREGARRAADVARHLRAHGHALAGIRLDSGDLAYLSIEARRILDEAGFPDARIMASNELDEHVIESLKEQGARIDSWGVGTRLATGHPDAALGGVYKLSAVRRRGARAWRHTLKSSDQASKATVPGILQVRRFENDAGLAADAIWDLLTPPTEPWTIVDPGDALRRKTIAAGCRSSDLLVPVVRGGRRVDEPPSLDETRRRAREQIARLHPGVKRFLNPHAYPAGLEQSLHDLRARLLLAHGASPAGEAPTPSPEETHPGPS